MDLQKFLGSMQQVLLLWGTFNYVAGNMKLPPKWMEKMGLEWVWRLIQEPKRLRRIINAVIIFPWKVFSYKLLNSISKAFFALYILPSTASTNL